MHDLETTDTAGIGRNLARALGIARSLAIYYGIPRRGRRLRRFYAPFVSPGALCFDIGAHVGNRVRCWRRLGARVLALEPNPSFARLLELLYGRDEHVTVLRMAVGREAGRGTLLISDRTPTVTSLSSEWVRSVRDSAGFRGVRWSAREEVPITTLDRLIADHGIPQFAKIDVEGYEAEVLGGLSIPLPALSFECLPLAREVALASIDRLAELGDYEYNWSPGETHALAWQPWRARADARRFIAELPARSESGDVYARRTRAAATA